MKITHNATTSINTIAAQIGATIFNIAVSFGVVIGPCLFGSSRRPVVEKLLEKWEDEYFYKEKRNTEYIICFQFLLHFHKVPYKIEDRVNYLTSIKTNIILEYRLSFITYNVMY